MSGAVAVKIEFSKALSQLFEKAGLKSIYAVARAIDEVGNKTKTKVVRATAAQAGVKYGKVLGVVSTRQAWGSAKTGQYEIIARDVTLSLKEFKPVQKSGGVEAAPCGRRIIFKHTFLGPGGHVYERVGKGRVPIRKLWGPTIPKEMVKDEAEATFYRVSAELLGPAIEKWLLRQVG